MGNRPRHERSAAVPHGLGNRTCIALLALLPFLPLASPSAAPRDVDARHCLDVGDNLAIARCAEQYRPGGPRATAPAPRAENPPAAAAPAPAPAPAMSAPKATSTAAPPPAPQRKRRARVADARHCLDLGDILAIARCAEKYR
jgi:hypothetical protein